MVQDSAEKYLSVAVQNDLKYVRLDDHINLGNFKFDKFNSQAAVKVTGKKSGSWIVRQGKSCTYGITLIKDSGNPAGALPFLQYLLAADGGLEIPKSMGQPPFVPCRVPTQQEFEMLPSDLKNLVEVRQQSEFKQFLIIATLTVCHEKKGVKNEAVICCSNLFGTYYLFFAGRLLG